MCSFCNNIGRVRCSVCKIWYCSQLCQVDHWPTHRRECVPVPDLEWPDGSKYNGSVESLKIGNSVRPSHVHSSLTRERNSEVVLESIEMPLGIHTVNSEVSEAKIDTNKISPSLTATKASTESSSVLLNARPSDQISETSAISKAIQSDGKIGPGTENPNFSNITISNTKKAAIDSKDKVIEKTKPVSDKPNDVSIIKRSSDIVVQETIVSDSKADVSSRKFQKVNTNSASKASVSTILPDELQSSGLIAPSKSTGSLNLVEENVSKINGPTSKVEFSPSDPSTNSGGIVSAYESSSLPAQVPVLDQLIQIVLPVEYVASPGDLSVRLISDDATFVNIMTRLNESPPPVVKGWKVGRRETVAVCHEEFWYRGLAVKKVDIKYYVYLLDIGGLPLEVTIDKLRPLPGFLMAFPALAYQVSLAGVGPLDGSEWQKEVGQMLKEILNADENFKIGIKFISQTDSGRWMVEMKGIDDNEDIGAILIQAEVVKARRDSYLKTKNVSSPRQSDATVCGVKTLNCNRGTEVSKSNPKFSPKSSVVEVETLGPKISRGKLPDEVNCQVTVCSLESPNKFYVCPISSSDLFINILESSQSTPPGKVLPTIGSTCLACDEDCWYRAEILSLQDNNVQLFLLDDGRVVTKTVGSLKPMTKELASKSGLVCAVTLRGVKPLGQEWSQSSIEGASMVLDVGGETQFKISNVEMNSTGLSTIDLTDMEGNKVANLMIETGLAAADVLVMNFGTLPLGNQKLLLLRASSPKDIVLCTQDKFLAFSNDIVPMVEKSAIESSNVVSPKVGDIVLACEDQMWYRAIVTEVIDGASVGVTLVDIAEDTTVSVEKLRVCKADVLEYTILGVICCLESWAQEDSKAVTDKWSSEMPKLIERFSELDVDVIKEYDGKMIVKIPSLESKMGKPNMSRTELLKMKLKAKK